MSELGHTTLIFRVNASVKYIYIFFFYLLPNLLVLCVLVVVPEVYQVDLLQLELIKLSLQGNYRIFTLQRVTKNNFIEVDNFDQTAAKLFRY